MAEIFLRFIQGRAFDSRIIEWQTRAWTSHVEYMFDRTSTLGAMLRGGVLIRSVDNPCYDGVKQTQMVRISASDFQFQRFHMFLNEQLGKPYDWRAIVSFAFGNRDWRAPDSYFCSELMAAALEDAGLLHIALPVDRISPRDLYLMVMNLP